MKSCFAEAEASAAFFSGGAGTAFAGVGDIQDYGGEGEREV
jgi:hypothetical protein